MTFKVSSPSPSSHQPQPSALLLPLVGSPGGHRWALCSSALCKAQTGLLETLVLVLLEWARLGCAPTLPTDLSSVGDLITLLTLPAHPQSFSVPLVWSLSPLCLTGLHFGKSAQSSPSYSERAVPGVSKARTQVGQMRHQGHKFKV